VVTRDEVLPLLQQQQVGLALRWAFESACEQAMDDFARGTGYTALSAGVGRYDLLADRLDRVFACGDYAVADGQEAVGLDVLYEGLSERARRTMPRIPAGLVVRSNLHGSNGWGIRGLRIITHSVQPGQIAAIDWTQESKTKKAVSRQEPSKLDEPNVLQVMLGPEAAAEFGSQDALPEVGIPTVVLVHSLDRDTGGRELEVGHSRYNDDDGSPWHWREDLLRGPGPEENGLDLPGGDPSPSQDVPDVEVRLRTVPAATREQK